MYKIETNEQLMEYLSETIPQQLFHVSATDIDDESGGKLEEVILIKMIAAHPEILKFHNLDYYINYFLRS